MPARTILQNFFLKISLRFSWRVVIFGQMKNDYMIEVKLGLDVFLIDYANRQVISKVNPNCVILWSDLRDEDWDAVEWAMNEAFSY